MGKIEEKTRQQQRYDEEQAQQNSSSSEIGCHRCSVVIERLSKDLSFKCVFILIMSFAILVYGIFSIVPIRHSQSGFDAQQAIKLSASAQAYFILEKPFLELIPHIGRLAYDINGEIGVPNTKVVILSMHKSAALNRTTVVFGALPDPINAPISTVSLSVMRSSLIEVYMKQTNLTLTPTIFGHPSKFDILKFQGGITVIPEYASIWQIPQILFNFTLHNSISETLENIVELKDQLKFGLHLRTYENVFVQVTNIIGSTAAAPVIVQASVTSEFGNLPAQRLRQLAEMLTGSPPRNLGLDNTVFGKVKSISLSSYLRGALSSPSPNLSPAPAPSPELTDYFGSSNPASPPYTQARTPAPTPALDTIDPPPSFETPESPPQPCAYLGSELPPSPTPTPSSNPIAPSTFSPGVSPVSQVVRASSSDESKGNTQGLRSSTFSPAPSTSAADHLYQTTWSAGLSVLIICHLFCWSN